MKSRSVSRFAMRWLAPALALTLSALPCRPQQGSADAWDTVLAGAGLTKEAVHFNQQDLAIMNPGPFRSAYFDALHSDPLRIPFFARLLRQSITTLAPKPEALAGFCADKVGIGTRRTLIGNPIESQEKAAAEQDSLLHAIQAICVEGGKPLTAAQAGQLKAKILAVPAEIQNQAALVLLLERDAYRWRQRALATFAATHDLQKMFDKLTQTDPNAADTPMGLDADTEALMSSIDLKRLIAGAEDLTQAANNASVALSKRAWTEKFSFDFDTPLGKIALHGAANDTYAGDVPYLLILDSGGNDTYHGGGGTFDAKHPVSVLIDLAGDDRYLQAPELANTPMEKYKGRKNASKHPAFGAGILGCGILIDVSGNDLYRATTQTMGRGHFGAGILLDKGGNDVYDGYALCEGSADFGIGILEDLGGADTYRCFVASQGYGGTMGCGLLCDMGTDADVYEANDTVLDSPSPQTPTHNVSLSQGCGNGRRADYLDGHSLSGGVGLLVDGGGNNSYKAGLFAQGAGYWAGVGMLSSGAGNDSYTGVWYVQGSAAHFAVGVLNDVGGDDHYTATMNMAQGAGHDYSVGFLIDEAGNDRYEAPNLSLGSGNANGFGFFWDKGGDDTYIVNPSTTLGGSSIEASGVGSIREKDLTLGIFLDTGGQDSYPAAIKTAKNSARWTRTEIAGKAPLPAMRGAGLDIEAADTPEPK